MKLRDGSVTQDPRLGRLVSDVTEHLDKYPLTTATVPSVATSMVAGVNWYSNFDDPELVKINGRWRWVIGHGNLGRIRGGHAVCLRNAELKDLVAWWEFYNQGVEGRCVEFAWLRERTQANRVRYDITSRWHYWKMQEGDEWAGGSYPGASPQYEGTSVRAGGVVMQEMGPIRARLRGRNITPDEAPALVRPEDGIEVYRWAQNWQDVRAVLGVPDDLPGVPVNNSWGRSYPHEVLLLDEAGERVLREQGEFGVVTDR